MYRLQSSLQDMKPSNLMLLLALALGLGACAGTARPDATPLPVLSAAGLDGSAILRERCTLCHDLGGLSVYAASWGQPEWRSMIETMVVYGARLSGPEVDTLAVYLGTHFGTDLTSTEAPTQGRAGTSEAANLLRSACTNCHHLSAIASNAGAYSEAGFRDTVQRMIGYGALVSQAQIEPLVGYLVEVYGRR